MNNMTARSLLKTKAKSKAERHKTRSAQESTTHPAIFPIASLRCDSFSHSNLRHSSTDDRCDLADLDHQFIELIGE